MSLEESKSEAIPNPQDPLSNKRQSVIERAIESYEYLITNKMVSNIGMNSDGLYYIVVYGYAFERSTKEDQGILTKHFEQLVMTLSEE